MSSMKEIILEKLKSLNYDKIGTEDISENHDESCLFITMIFPFGHVMICYEPDPDDVDYLASIHRNNHKISIGLDDNTIDGVIDKIRKEITKFK